MRGNLGHILLVSIVCWHKAISQFNNFNRPVITTRQGSLLGRDEFVSGRRVYSFRGIKYADVRARFTYSTPYTASWSGTKSAVDNGLPCPQPWASSQYSEDCLHLSVTTPSLSSNRRVPVLVFLTGSLFTYDQYTTLSPESLVAERNIIVVTVSSRLNVFGFLSLENVVVPGNMGLLDQYLALLWVRDNIQYFGGDVNRMTLAGSGSGGASALYLSLSSRSSGLVSRVMSMSGTPMSPWAASVNAADNAKRFVTRVNCNGPTSRAVLTCLQAKNAREIISALESHLSTGNISHIFAPVQDTFLAPADQFIGNSINDLDRGLVNRRTTFMIGENEDDASEIMIFFRRNFDRLNARDVKYFVDNTLIPVSLQKYPNLINSAFIRQLLSFQYFPTQVSGVSPSGKEDLLESVQTFLTDNYYAAPTRDFINKLGSGQATVYSFVNTHRIKEIDGYLTGQYAGASSIIALLFGGKQFELQTGLRMQGVDREVSNRVHNAIVPFIDNGQPDSLLRWPRYTLQNKHYLEVNSLRLYTQYKVAKRLNHAVSYFLRTVGPRSSLVILVCCRRETLHFG